MTYICPPRKAMSDCDWVAPLRSYISSIYGPGEHFSEQIAALHRLRQDAKGAAIDPTGRDIVYKYYGQLELLDLRIPIGEHGCRMAFTWADSFTHEQITQYSMAFEKASLLYNLACVNCAIAAESDDIKVAYNGFQAAAGIFSFVVDNFLHAPSTDLHQDTVRALTKLALAQGQEVFTKKAINDQTSKPSIVAKLCRGASNLYKAAAEGLKTVLTDKTWGDPSWHLLAQVKSKYFLALANDYQARHTEATGKYGDSVAYMGVAVTTIKEASSQFVPGPQGVELKAEIKIYREALVVRHKDVENDNDLIYHATVTAMANLPEISGVEAAKPTPMNDLYKNMSQIVGRDIFEQLIPLAVHEKSSLYSEEKASVLRAEAEKVDVAEQELASALEFLDLPGALSLVKDGTGTGGGSSSSEVEIPVVVNDWAAEVSVSTLTLESVEAKRSAILQRVRTIEQQLSNEKQEYDQMKLRYGARWAQVDSGSLSAGIQADLQSIKESLSTGATSDSRVRDMLGQARADIALLKGGPDNSQLKQAFTFAQATTPASTGMSLLDLDTSSQDNVPKLLDQTEELLSQLNRLSRERKALYAELKDKVHKDDISALLILNSKVPDVEKQLFQSELDKFRPYQTRLGQANHHQKTLLAELTAVWKQVLSNESVRQRTSSRDQLRNHKAIVVERLRKAFSLFKDAQEGLEKGSDFYSHLDGYTSSVAENAAQFIQNRQEERAKMSSMDSGSPQYGADQLRHQLSGLTVQPTTNTAWRDVASLDRQAQSSVSPPQLPPKPGQYGQSPAPIPTHQSQGPSGAYGTPSVYDPSMYSYQNAPKQQQQQQQQQPPPPQQQQQPPPQQPQQPLPGQMYSYQPYSYQPGYSFQN